MKLNVKFLTNIGIIIAILISYYLSFLLGVVVFIFFTLVTKKVTFFSYLFFILSLGLISFTNYSDILKGDYDILRYYSYWSILSDIHNLSEALAQIYMMGDYLFYFLVWIFSQLAPPDSRWFGFIFTSLISLLLFLSLRNVMKKEGMGELLYDIKTFIIFALGFLLIINFYDYTNGYRQHLAFATLLYIITLDIGNKQKLPLFLIPVTMHWSMAMPLFLYFFLLNKTIRKNIFIVSPIILLSGVIFIPFFSYILNLFGNETNYLTQEALGVDKKIILIMLVSTLYVTIYSIRNNMNVSSQAIIASLFVISLIFVTRSTIISRMSFNWTDVLVVISPYIFEKSRRARNFNIFILVWGIFTLYHFMSIFNKSLSEYLLFSQYGVVSSVKFVLETTNPMIL